MSKLSLHNINIEKTRKIENSFFVSSVSSDVHNIDMSRLKSVV